MTLAYDVTEIVPGERKGEVLRIGHIITDADLETLKRIGKSYLRVLVLDPGELHEDEAAARLAQLLAGPGIEVTMPGEAWADLRATQPGLLKVDATRLLEINLLEDLLVTTFPANSPVKEGQVVARAKVRDLAVRQEVLDAARAIAAGEPILRIVPFHKVKAGAVITGREVYEGRVRDAFAPLLRQRLHDYGSELACVRVVPDTKDEIASAIGLLLAEGMEMILVTGGMSPDDSTFEGIRKSGAQVVFHGVPVAPGAMSALAYLGEVPVVGIPGGLLARPRGFFDLLLPRLLAGEKPSREDVARYGYGGLCWGCKVCVFPACAFGRAAPTDIVAPANQLADTCGPTPGALPHLQS
ncbi:MAG: molybdopterin-binding protein [Thermoleophilia bacterium]|nr:molybdopterin-binding protein [Thermoleophilia bacterium]